MHVHHMLSLKSKFSNWNKFHTLISCEWLCQAWALCRPPLRAALLQRIQTRRFGSRTPSLNLERAGLSRSMTSSLKLCSCTFWLLILSLSFLCFHVWYHNSTPFFSSFLFLGWWAFFSLWFMRWILGPIMWYALILNLGFDWQCMLFWNIETWGVYYLEVGLIELLLYLIIDICFGIYLLTCIGLCLILNFVLRSWELGLSGNWVHGTYSISDLLRGFWVLSCDNCWFSTWVI